MPSGNAFTHASVPRHQFVSFDLQASACARRLDGHMQRRDSRTLPNNIKLPDLLGAYDAALHKHAWEAVYHDRASRAPEPLQRFARSSGHGVSGGWRLQELAVGATVGCMCASADMRVLAFCTGARSERIQRSFLAMTDISMPRLMRHLRCHLRRNLLGMQNTAQLLLLMIALKRRQYDSWLPAEQRLVVWCPEVDVEAATASLDLEGGAAACDMLPSGELIFIAGDQSVQVLRVQLLDVRSGSLPADGDAGAADNEAAPLGHATPPVLGDRYADLAAAVLSKQAEGLGAATQRLNVQSLGSLAAPVSDAFCGVHVDPSGQRLLAISESDGVFVWSLSPDTLHEHVQSAAPLLQVRYFARTTRLTTDSLCDSTTLHLESCTVLRSMGTCHACAP